MRKHVKAGDSIECNRSMVAVRKISKNPTLVKIDDVIGRLYKYKTSISAIVSITEVLGKENEYRINKLSKIDLNDSLEAEVIEIYTKKQMKIKLESNFSHVHSMQTSEVPCFTFAKIVIPWKFVSDSLNKLTTGQKKIS